MSGQAAESGGSRPVIHTKAMPSPGQYGFVLLACILHLFIHTALRLSAGECGRFPARVHLFIQPPSTGSPAHGLAEGGRIYSSSAQLAHALALQVQQAFYLFIPASTPFIILGVRPLSPFIYSSAALKLLGRVLQVTLAPFIYSSAALKLLERVEQVTHARFIYSS